MKLESKWHGPYCFIPSEKFPWIYDSEHANNPGIYLWTVLVGNEYLVNYVGVSGKSMLSRQEEHLQSFLSGSYTFYDADALKLGKKNDVFLAQKGVQEFLRNVEYHQRMLMSQLLIMRVFFAPFLDVDVLTLNRIESALIFTLRNTDDYASSFLDNERLSAKLQESERDLSVVISDGGILKGVPEAFHA